MFTGIVQAIGVLESREVRANGQRLRVGTGQLPLDDAAPGGSIAVNGACLTVIGIHDGAFVADVSAETLSMTTLGKVVIGAPLNLEKPLVAGSPLGGHLVSGHVDGTGQVAAYEPAGESVRLRVSVPAALSRYLARKGSVCVDGVSLTVNTVNGVVFETNLVPHTLSHTALGGLKSGDEVNIEVDMIARYIERLQAAG